MTIIESSAAVDAFDVAAIKSQFKILERLIHGKPVVYLDSAASSQRPRQVLDAIRDYDEWHHANVHRGIHTLGEEATAMYEGARDKIAAFLHAGDRRARVLLGGLAAAPVVAGEIPATDFLAAACAEGRCTGVDGVAYHPYTFPQAPLDDREPNRWLQMDQDSALGPSVRSVLAGVGLGHTPIWVTEYGAPTGGGPEDVAGRDYVSERAQADLVSQAVRAAAADRDLAGIFVYTWDDLADTDSVEGHYGVVRRDGDHKPAYAALRAAATAVHR